MIHLHTLPEAPDLLALYAHDRVSFPYLLQSAGDTGMDILFALPAQQTIYHAGQAAQCAQDLASLPIDPAHTQDARFPFIGGWFFYLGYEMLHHFEPSVPPALDDGFPLAVLARVPAAVVVERATGQAYLMAETAALLAQLQAKIATATALVSKPLAILALEEDDPAVFTDAVKKIKHYIREGDVFQVNVSREWRACLPAQTQPADVFRALRLANPAPFSALADFGEQQIVSSSPERLVRVQDGWVDTRPIAGTHPRSTDPIEDAALKQRLIDNRKERAEHVMLIDLERNDLGRICVPGTVEVNELMAVASYTYVHHIESNVRGRPRAGIRPIDVFRALFPGGTITGCPKIRCMQIIRELETSARRAYTGSLGYINRDGSLDSNILIRSFMMENDSLRFRAGAGIVADSDPDRELSETRHKARGLLRALGIVDSL